MKVLHSWLNDLTPLGDDTGAIAAAMTSVGLAVEEVLSVCDHYVLGDTGGTLDPTHLEDAKREMGKLNAEGFRVVAVAFKEFVTPSATYQEAEEAGRAPPISSQMRRPAGR